jgi:hypothetical protein
MTILHAWCSEHESWATVLEAGIQIDRFFCLDTLKAVIEQWLYSMHGVLNTRYPKGPKTPSELFTVEYTILFRLGSLASIASVGVSVKLLNSLLRISNLLFITYL